MIFLTVSDFDTLIKAENLTQIIESNDGLLEAAVLASISEMTSYLRTRYDVNEIFNIATASTSGDTRNQQLVMYGVDIALYHVHARVSPRSLPESRLARYEQAITFLKMVNKGSLLPDLPLKQTESNNNGIVYGSVSKFYYD